MSPTRMPCTAVCRMDTFVNAPSSDHLSMLWSSSVRGGVCHESVSRVM